ncbi:MAG TPA: hypothetical protein VEP66_06890, partial [Myxococcales bacterium]|nr:hypothetical protein [Myxococcales bacterium]
WELRFCSNTTGTNCSTYTGPNGQWDSSTTIWVPTWVVFSDNAAPFTVPAGQPQPPPPPPPTISYSPACVAEKSSSFADIYVYDEYLNSPPAGTTYSDAKVDRGTSITAVKHGFFDEMDNWGAMGKFGLDFDYWPVLPSGGACAAPASPTAPTACVLRLLFRSFDLGFRGTLEAVNGNATSGTCGAPATFQTSIGVVNVKGATFHGGQVGQNAP